MLGETDLVELGLTLEQAKALSGALKSTRAQQPARRKRPRKRTAK